MVRRYYQGNICLHGILKMSVKIGDTASSHAFTSKRGSGARLLDK